MLLKRIKETEEINRVIEHKYYSLVAKIKERAKGGSNG